MAKLEITDLSVNVEDTEILRGVSLTIQSGETHAIMGPNGSGKSTLAYAVAGHPKYTVTGGTVTLDGADVLDMSVDERARAGVFLAMQYPVEVPGRLGLQLPPYVGDCGPRRGAQAAALGQGAQGDDEAAWRWTRSSPSAASTRASPAARRSATRSCSSSC
jgi:ABC-type iron transport system FetAB ATPase subunit